MTTYSKSSVLQWIRKLRSRRSQSGEFEYKPLLVLSVLEILDKNPEHPNSFQYEELFEASKVVASRNSWEIDEQQFAHPYIRLKNDKQPIQVWMPQAIEGIDLDRYETVYPPYVKRDVPSIKINDNLWEYFQDLDDRTSFEKEIEDRLSDSEELPLLAALEIDTDSELPEISSGSIYSGEENSKSEEDLHYSSEKTSSSQENPPQFTNYQHSPSRYSFSQLLEETNLESNQLKKWIRVINRKKQAIFYGPPGTGKTFIAQCIANYLVDGRESCTELIQFHPSYTYEDFIQGIRPTVQGGLIQFQPVDGRFLEFCKSADRNRNINFVLIIDEFNRANLSNVFGELMYLLEYRDANSEVINGKKTQISLSGGERFGIPENITILGTMNTADRSIALVDYALRRRFAFIELLPDYDLLARYHERIGSNFRVEKLIDVLRKVNQTIGDKNYEIGVSFFMDKNLENNLEDIWTYEIEPYIEEYFFGQPQKINGFRWKKVLEELNK